MKLWRELLGLFLIALAWLNPLEFNVNVQIILFILGFDMMSTIPKILVFGVNFLFEFLTGFLAWAILILIAVDLITRFLLMGFLFNIILKPLAVFAAGYLNGLSLYFCIGLAVVDIILNLTKK
jgi:hypothetical protein